MKTIELKRDRDKPLMFDGELLAEVSTRHRRERWTELRLYRTDQRASWIAQEIARSTMRGELDRHKVWCCSSEADLRTQVGDGPLARQLYLEAGLDGVESLDNEEN